MTNQALAKPQRYLAVDSLRGIAALSVAMFHLYVPSFEGFTGGEISFLSKIFQFGYLGVPIFFVISGFVIAATVKPSQVDFHYIGKFIVKRAVRLDPPYWLSIAMDIGLVFLTIQIFKLPGEIPSPAKIVAHIFYLQNLLGMGDIAANYWTLCLEVQFYIFLTLIFAIAGKLHGYVRHPTYSRTFIVAAFSSTVFISLLITSGLIRNPVQGLFLTHWYLFALGATCYWASIAKSINYRVFFGYCLCAFTVFLVQVQKDFYLSLNTLSAIVTALFLFLAAYRQKMSTWLNHRILIYLGAISYSLYLFHGIIGDRFISFLKKWLLPHLGLSMQSSFSALLLFCAALGVSIVASHLVYRFIEKPSVKISRKIKPENDASILSDIRSEKAKNEYAPAN